MKGYMIAIYVIVLLECAFLGWQYVNSTKKIWRAIHQIEEHQEQIQNILQQHLGEGLELKSKYNG